MVDPSVERSTRKYLRLIRDHGIEVRFGVVFGSRATGHTGYWSDIDVLVVSPRFDGPRDRNDIDLLWRLAAKTDSRIEPIPCGEMQWREDTSSAMVELARREGRTISLEEQKMEPGEPHISPPRDLIADFCRRSHIRRLALFGSILREDFGPESDVDVLVEFEPEHVPGFFRLIEMEEELSNMFGGRKVDIRTPQDLSRYFRTEVMTHAEEQYAQE